jgi:hypothetical protein
MNHAFKHLLETNVPLVDLFHALKTMTKAHLEARAFTDFQTRGRPKIYHPLISPLAGHVVSYILDSLETECSRINHLFIGTIESDHVNFNDSYRYYWEHGCNCSFFTNFSAPCIHVLKWRGVPPLSSFHSVWRVDSLPIPQPAILHGPRQEIQLSAEDKILAELFDTVSYVQTRLFDMDKATALSFAKRFQDLLDRKELNAPTNIRDPPVSKPRGRPKKRAGNSFNGNLHLQFY